MTLHVLRKLDWFVGLALATILSPIARALGAILRRDHSFSSVKSIAVVKLLGGGNFALALPLLLAIRKQLPDCNLTAIVTPSTAHFAHVVGIFDKIEVIDFKSPLSLLRSTLRTIVAVFRVDVLLDLEIYSKLATCFGLFTCARNRMGFFTNDFFLRKHLYTHLVFFNPQALRSDLYKQLAFLLDATAATHQECGDHLRALLGSPPIDQDLVIVGVGCSDLGTVRRLDCAQWVRILGERLTPFLSSRVVFLGSAVDAAEAQSIIAQLALLFPGMKIENLCGVTPLDESLRILASSRFFWGIDSALLHFARMLSVPSESFWGPTDPATRLEPINNYSERIHYKRIICSPCIQVAEDPPCRGRNLCIQGLFSTEPIEVSRALENTTFYPSDRTKPER